MEEIVLVTSNKDSSGIGIGVVDIKYDNNLKP
jgi:hypothetical protein